ncbi:MAG: toll/interleukin-1 receptor domain-containing protein, partial [Bacteroidales bacterium]|nr:toll/interleukin-1 receptor domain-containing protein [Bacteroidales bacterium]
MSGKNFDVFISYRRSDGTDKARILDLAFGIDDCRTFLDFKSLGVGAFDKRLEDAVLDAPIFVMVLTPDYFARCNEEGDWVRKEIELALDNNKIIIPINYDGKVNCAPDYLDEEFKSRVGCHNFKALHRDSSFDATVKSIFDLHIRPHLSPIHDNDSKAKVSVITDADCELILDDEIVATVQAGKTKQIFVERGEHFFIARSTEFPQIEEEIEKIVNNLSSKYTIKIKLKDRVEQDNNSIQNKKNDKVKNIFKGLGLIVFSIIGAVSLFFGIGFMYGYFSSSNETDSILNDNTVVADNSLLFEFGSLKACYNLENDSIEINTKSVSNYETKISNADLFVSCISFAGSKSFFEKSVSKLKYLRFLKGGSRPAKITKLIITAAVLIGTFTGFSQGCNYGKLISQKVAVGEMFPLLESPETWRSIFENNPKIYWEYPYIVAKACPINEICHAYKNGIIEEVITIKYNKYKLGDSISNLQREIDSSKNKIKNCVFFHLSSNDFKPYELPENIVGLEFRYEYATKEQYNYLQK